MNIQYQFTIPTNGGEIRLFANGTAHAENWCGEFSDWQIEHISIDNIEGSYGEKWSVDHFSAVQLSQIHLGLLVAARRKSAMNPTLAANLRKMLNLPAFDAKPEPFAG